MSLCLLIIRATIITVYSIAVVCALVLMADPVVYNYMSITNPTVQENKGGAGSPTISCDCPPTQSLEWLPQLGVGKDIVAMAVTIYI